MCRTNACAYLMQIKFKDEDLEAGMDDSAHTAANGTAHVPAAASK